MAVAGRRQGTQLGRRELRAGRLGAARFGAAWRRDEPDPETIDARFAFSGAELRYLDTFPTATGLAGDAALTRDTLDLTLRSGQSAG